MPVEYLHVRSSGSHFRVLGIFWAVYGAIRLVEAVWLIAFSSTATLMFGSMLMRVPDPFTVMNGFHLLYAAVEALAIASGLLGILAGVALLAGTRAPRALVLTAAFLALPNLPLGIMLGTYTLIVLIPMGDGRTSS